MVGDPTWLWAIVLDILEVMALGPCLAGLACRAEGEAEAEVCVCDIPSVILRRGRFWARRLWRTGQAGGCRDLRGQVRA